MILLLYNLTSEQLFNTIFNALHNLIHFSENIYGFWVNSEYNLKSPNVFGL